ncbi:MAG: hypothetical protein GYA23_00445 [Methanomicrobiales archaeon]|nr:hypothetical protein [Methanomicrobiales archaeon]
MRLRPVPPLLPDVIRAAIRVCDMTEYSPVGHCPSCGGTLSGYDTRTKRFAVLCDADGDWPVEVIIHRAYCRECGRIVVPEEPFYPGTRIGSPIVDLCTTLASSGSHGNVTAFLDRLGVKVDRWSVRSYCHLSIPAPKTISMFGMQLPASIIVLSSLAGDIAQGQKARGTDVLAACNFPSRYLGVTFSGMIFSSLFDLSALVIFLNDLLMV